MDARISRIRDGIATNHAETASMLKGLAPDDLAKRAANGWTVAQLAGHVAVSPKSAIYVLDRVRKNGNATVPSFLSWVVALRNWNITRKYKNASPDDMLKTADDARDEVLRWVDGVKDDELDNAGEVFGSGRQSVAQFLEYILEHGREHRGEIAAALGRTPAQVSI